MQIHTHGWVLPAVLLSSIFATVETRADIYRCTDGNGHVSFQQFRCDAGSKPLSIRTPPVGWTALRPGERRLLDTIDRSAKPLRPQNPGQLSAKTDVRSCEKQRNQLAALKRRLRRGYPLQESDRLHQQQQTYQRFLARHCAR